MELLEKVRAAKRVYVIGNGGSYANAGHIVNDLLLVGIRAFPLDPATLTATANDFGYQYVFARWLSVVADPGDLLIALSGSGKSPNILEAIAVAEKIGMTVHRIFGNFGAPKVESNEGVNMQQAEEIQLMFGHNVMRTLRK